jgi:membrane protein implicated in regulation of membrane protease activity
MFGFEPWHIWLIAAVLFFVAEVFVPGFVLASLGIGAVIAAGVHQYTGDLNWGVGGWIVGAFLSFVFLRPVVVRTLVDDTPSGFGASGMIGNTVIVSDSEDVGGTLKARYRDSDWSLESEDDLIEGDTVTITNVRGTTLVVKKEL